MRVYGQKVWSPEGSEGGDVAPPADPAAPAAPPTQEGAPPAEAPKAALESTLLTPKPGEEGKTPEEPKPGEEPKKDDPPAEIKPEDYKLELPEGIKADDVMLVAFLEGAAKGGMDNESVNSVIAALGPKLAEERARPLKEWTTLNETWQQEVKADPVIGGANLDATVSTVSRAIDLVCDPEQSRAVREALTITGAGNNPHVVRLLHGLASRLVEGGKHVNGNTPSESPSAAALLYPSHNRSAANGG